MIILQSIIPQFRTLTTPIKYEKHKEILRNVKNKEYSQEEIVSLIEEFAWQNEHLFDSYESVRKELNHFKNIRWEPNRADAVRNRRRALKQLNKAIKRKNERIAQLEAQLRLSKESEERANNMCVSRIFSAAEMFGQVIAFLPEKEDK